MADIQVSTTNINERIENNINQAITSSCTVTAANTIKDTLIIIENIRGAVNIDQVALVDSRCSIAASLQSNLQNVQKSIGKTKQKTQDSPVDWQLSFKEATTNEKEYISNYLSQVITTSCKVETTNTLDNDIIFIKDAGTVNINQNIQSHSNCLLNNTAKSTIFNLQLGESTTDQSSESLLGALFKMIALIVVVAIVGGIISMIIMGEEKEKEEGRREIQQGNGEGFATRADFQRGEGIELQPTQFSAPEQFAEPAPRTGGRSFLRGNSLQNVRATTEDISGRAQSARTTAEGIKSNIQSTKESAQGIRGLLGSAEKAVEEVGPEAAEAV